MVTETQPEIAIDFDAVNQQQYGFITSKANRLLFSGAFGSGKTIALCAKGLQLSTDYPGNIGFICRKTRSSLTFSTLETFLRWVCPRELIASHNKQEGLITLVNGSQILFGGLDDPLKLGSLGPGGIGWVGIDEAIETTEEDWQMLEGRLRMPGVPHQIFAATNPGPPSHYLYRMFFTEKRGEVYQASSYDNPELPEDYKARLSEFEGVYRDRYVLGLWRGLEGLVYSSFDDIGCVLPRFKIPNNWLVYTGHDFGDANPAAMFYAENPGTGDFYAFAEYLPGGGKVEHDHVQEFKRITEGYNVVRRAGGNHTTEGASRRGFAAHGWPILEPKHSQNPRYQMQLVQGMHRLNKIYAFSDMTNYLREKLSFAYEKKEGVLTEKIANEAAFHLMCLVAGTMVKTVKGDRPIETVRQGDLVLTRNGYREVKLAGKTGVKDTSTVRFSNGASLRGTLGHRIGVEGRGFVPLAALRYNDIIEVWKEKQSSIGEQSITDTQKRRDGAIGYISGQARDTFTELYGRIPLANYRRAIVCITKTMTQRIMSLVTLNVRQLVSTCQAIWWGMSTTLTIFGISNRSALLVGSDGQQLLKARQTLSSVRNGNGGRRCQLLKSAFSVDKNIRQLSQSIAGFAQVDASQPLGITVQDIRPSGKAVVYDLSVDVVHEYYANDILVHNSAERGILSDFTPETVQKSKNSGIVVVGW